MPLEVALPPIEDRVAELNARYARHAAADILEDALGDAMIGQSTLVSSFGAEAVVLLHMVANIDRTVPILFIDTEMLFPETLEYQREISGRLGLTNVQVIRPDRSRMFLKDPNNSLHKADTDACCALRKGEPLDAALTPYDAWITGRKRYQTGRRAMLDLFEVEAGVRIKINPLAHWTSKDVQDYMTNNRLPRHPLVARGYPSLGCLPCTTRVAPGEDLRAGRWRGTPKDECGIHFEDGKVVQNSQKVA